jgi:colanic acid/amylovoran biosynthesis glycosyltransferase
MKVAFVLGRFPLLSETFILNQITGLLDRGVEVQIHALAGGDGAKYHPEVIRRRLLDRTCYASTDGPGGSRRLALVRSVLRGLLRTEGKPHRMRDVLRHGRGDAAAAFPFTELAATPIAYDAILCHFGPYGQLALSLRNLGLMQGPIVTAFHGYDLSRQLRSAGDDTYQRLFRDGDLFLPISEHWRNRLIELGCPPSRTIVHRMGVDRGCFVVPVRQPPTPDRFRLLTVGRLVEKKGMEYAVRAVASLAGRLPGLEYTIIGDGPLKDELATLSRQLGVDHHVRMLGSRTTDQVASEMRRAQVLVAPSVTAEDGDQEGIPVVLMEAMASGLPVVSTLHTGIPELVVDGQTGYLVPERDVTALADRLIRLAFDAVKYTAMAERSPRRIEQEHDIDILNQRLIELFRSL